MKLTRRQKLFLGKFLELYRQAKKPLHYSDVAESFGVARITAYDMLRLLEERGLVRSEYVLRGKGRGPGRSTVMSAPTPQAFELLLESKTPGWDWAEWEQVRTEILERIRQGADYQKLLEEITTQLSERTTPLVYAAQMATAVILHLVLIEEGSSTARLVERLKSLGLPDEVGLDALSGLTVGLSLVERANRHITDRLVGATQGYQLALARLGGEGKRHLSSFIGELMQAVTS
jgi:transposase